MRRLVDYTFRVAKIELYLFWLGYFALVFAITGGISVVTSQTQTYTVFREINESGLFWFLLYGLSGLFSIYSCHFRHKKLYMYASMLMTVLWAFTTFAISINSNFYFNTGTAVYGTFMLVAAWCYLRAGSNDFDETWN